mmetsp:Transcript_37662/g.111776  ORF Transcript_37662/g.111776 Transcript_37662/m.111776 type:complete len:148 (-) Transcript_37662:520-963(-)
MCPGGAIATVATCPGTILAIGGAPGGAWTSVAIGGGSIRVGPCTILATGGPATDVATDVLDPMGSSSSSHTHRPAVLALPASTGPGRGGDRERVCARTCAPAGITLGCGKFGRSAVAWGGRSGDRDRVCCGVAYSGYGDASVVAVAE